MSIRDEIRSRTRERPPRLFFLPPLLPGAWIVRELFVSEEINQLAHNPEPRFAEMRAELDRWTQGGIITVAEDPYRKPRATFMARIDPAPDEVFDIRVRAPNPGIRVFGCFADRDLFVALTMSSRDELATDKDWRDAREACKAAWRRLFPTYQPFSGANLNEYISGNIFVVEPRRRRGRS